MKFCLHPISLQGLMDIANTPKLAKHVTVVAFDSWLPASIDPIHDDSVKHGVTVHPKLTIPPMTREEVLRTRIRTDSIVITQSLLRFPNLELVIIGNHLQANGPAVRSSYGKAKVVAFKCHLGHCTQIETYNILYAFRIVSLALEQLTQLSSIKVGVAVENHDLPGVVHAQQGWQASNEVFGAINNLQLSLDPDDHDLTFHSVAELARHANIEALDITYGLSINHNWFGRQISMSLRHQSLIKTDPLPLHHLRRISLTQLCTVASLLTGLLYEHADRLEHVNLSDCLIQDPAWRSSVSIADGLGWKCILQALESIRKLSFLHLERLSADFGGSLDLPRSYEEQFSEESLFAATWKTREEISKGLHYLAATLGSTTRKPRCSISYIIGSEQKFLNLRWANFKAASRYTLKEAEARALAGYRKLRGNRGLLFDIRDDKAVLPLPEYLQEYKLPEHHHLLPDLPWGKWKTVWVKNARRKWKFADWEELRE